MPKLLSKIMFSVFGGVGFTVVLLFCMVPVELLRSKLKKRHRELTEPLGLYDSEHNLSPYQQNQQQQRSSSSHVFTNSETTNLRFFSQNLSLFCYSPRFKFFTFRFQINKYTDSLSFFSDFSPTLDFHFLLIY